MTLPSGPFAAILADPPWRFACWSGKGAARSADNHYDTMPLAEIKALPVADIAADDCVLFMWACWPMLPEALELIDAWGFTYKTCGFDWMKELKPCPFCGNHDIEQEETITDAAVICRNCGSRTGFVFLGPDDASNAAKMREQRNVWNTRTANKQQAETIARLKEALGRIQRQDYEPKQTEAGESFTAAATMIGRLPLRDRECPERSPRSMSTPFDDELVERVARAAFAAHHATGPTEEAYSEPNWGRGGFKTERAVWDAVARAALEASPISEMRALLDELREALAVLPVGAEWNIIGERGYRRDDLLAKINAALKAGQS